ncbi:hypothetical protein E0H39_06985 [Rhizobium leguminosarum bv. viciae]|uniref:ATP-binding protein n=1 Tax=Rhizobium leguminosarum TaxID=384 RepID=UPI0010391C13|nr:ATP-binding protein [Rhizobium leguminosarum]TBY65737.1 hypothetical protein E0H39_06985 [Rhizobium leguminosarum bv. viciae]
MEMVNSKGQIAARFRAMRIVHPLAEAAFDIMDDMRVCKQDSDDGEEQLAGELFADSHAGKSTTIRMYLETRVYNECIVRGLFPSGTDKKDVLKLQKLVLFIEIPADTRVKALLSALLKKLDDPFPTKGNVTEMLHRVQILLKKHNVELIIFDEVGHLTIPKTDDDEAAKIHNHLTSFLRMGYPVLFVGIKAARSKIFGDSQGENRSMYDIDFLDFDYSNEAHRTIFRDFCADLSISLVEKGIMREWSDFVGDGDEILSALFEVSLGLLGGVARIVERACKFAFDEKALKVEIRHLEAAVDRLKGFANRSKGTRRNPFRDGLAAAKVVSHAA